MIPGPGCSGSMITAAPTLCSAMNRAASRSVRPGVIVSTFSVIASRTFTFAETIRNPDAGCDIVRRWARYTGNTDSRITTTPTTLTIGTWFGRERLVRIHIGSVCCRAGGERRDDHLVEEQREGEQPAGEQRRAHQRERHAAGTSASAAPRSADASSSEPDVRRSRATTLL